MGWRSTSDPRPRHIVRDAHALSEGEHSDLAYRMLNTVGTAQAKADAERAWAETVAARVADLRVGKAPTRPLVDAVEDIRARRLARRA